MSIRATFAKSCSSSSGNRFRSNCPLRSGPMPGAGPCSLLSVGPCQLRSGPKPGVGPCPLRSCSIPSAGLCPLRSGPAPGVGPCLLRSVLMLCATRCLLSASTPPHHVIPQSGRSSLRPPDSGSHRQYHAQLLLSCQSLPCCQALGSSCDPSACHAFLCVDSLYHSSPHSSHSCGESCQPPAS